MLFFLTIFFVEQILPRGEVFQPYPHPRKTEEGKAASQLGSQAGIHPVQ
jgi:hypothetical protein